MLSPVPENALAYFRPSDEVKRAGLVDDEIRENDPGRHRTLLSLAGSMRHRGMSSDEIAVALLVVNERRCKPPLPEAEVVELARDVARRYHPAPPDLEQKRIEQKAERILGHAPPNAAPSSSSRRRELRRRATSTIFARAVEWLIANVVPLGTLSLVAGVGGLGKSMLALAWAADVTRERSNVLVISYEDAAEQVLRPRFEALGGDLDRLFVLEIDPVEGSISFPLDLEELARHVRETDARLVLIDPVSASIDLKLDAHKDRDVRVVLGRLARLAEDLNVAVVMIAHLNKAPGSDPYLRINGSTAFYNASRSVLTVTRDPGQELYRLVAHHKSNYGLLGPVERWALEVVEIASTDGPIDVARLVFLEVADDVSRDDVLAPPVAEKRSDAETLIVAELAFGRRLSSEVKTAGKEAGISERTMKRAAQELGIVVEEEATDTGRVTYWSLPEWVGPGSTSHNLARPPSGRTVKPDQGGQANTPETGVDPTPSAPICVVCDAVFDPDDPGATGLRCPDCVNRSQRKGATP